MTVITKANINVKINIIIKYFETIICINFYKFFKNN